MRSWRVVHRQWTAACGLLPLISFPRLLIVELASEIELLIDGITSDGWYVRYCWARWNFWFRNLTRVCLPSEVVHKLAVRRLGPRAAALGDRGWRRKMLGWMMRLNAAPLCTELLRRRNWSCVLWGGGIIRD